MAALRDAHITIVIATSADYEEMDALLRQALVADLIFRRSSKDDASKTKPDPDIVTAALSSAHVRAQDAVLIGDTPYDIEAARRAAVAAIALRCGGYWTDDDFADADEIFDHPAAIRHRWQAARLRSEHQQARIRELLAVLQLWILLIVLPTDRDLIPVVVLHVAWFGFVPIPVGHCAL